MPALKVFLTYTVVSIPISAFYLLVALPAVHGFETLALALAPVFLVLGAYAARPRRRGPWPLCSAWPGSSGSRIPASATSSPTPTACWHRSSES